MSGPGTTEIVVGDESFYVSNYAVGAQLAEQEKRTYQEKLEEASHDDVFRYVFLINSASVEKYVQQSREQAETAFRLSQKVAIAGFALLGVGIVIGLVSQFTDHALTTAYLAGVGGVLTEFIAGVFFWIYNRTLQQINLFYEGMMKQQHEALEAIGRSSENLAKGQELATAVRSEAGAVRANEDTPQESR
jgi:F0F1-type ATP synthase assembly protein I